MIYDKNTQVPNFLFDTYLPNLTEAELKITLVVIRQTQGWLNARTGNRKERDRISGYQFREKTGLSKRIITKSINSLVQKNLLQVTDYTRKILHTPNERKGKSYLYYSLAKPAHSKASPSAHTVPQSVQKRYHNKRKKEKGSKINESFTGHISQLLPTNETLFPS